MENESNEKNHVSIGNGSWFNKVKQGSENGKEGGPSLCKVILAVLAALASIATVIGVLYTLKVI